MIPGRNTRQFLLLFAALLLALVAIYADIRVLKNGMKETSLVEAAQAILILGSGIFFAVSARKDTEKRAYLAFVATLFLCMFVRENDAYLDVITHGFWRVPVLVILCIGALVFIPNRKTFGSAARLHAQDSSFWIMVIGILQLVVFSRLFGSSQLWSHVVSQEVGTIKTVVQEGTELMGYALIFVGAYLSHRHRYGEEA
ncbi:MAG: hypothetical protein AB3N11_13830 [Arenibacterium sp.]